MLGRRGFLTASMSMMLAIGARPAAAASEALEWALWRGLHVGSGGRVIDDANGGITHSEGQGYGMLLAVSFDDPATFAWIWSWTRSNLMIRGDGLFAWRWEPGAVPPVTDVNNATDGDLLIAWALARAASRWSNGDYAQSARRLADAILDHVTVERGERLLMLPGADGFVASNGTVVVNPSYWVFPALSTLGRLGGDSRWDRLYRDGLALIEDGRRPGRTVADWLAVGQDGRVGPAAGFGFRTGYNAYRVPLYLLWAGETAAPVLDAFSRVWAQAGQRTLPMEISAEDGLIVSMSDDPGYRDLPALLACARGLVPGYSPTRVDATRSYYAATLALLTRIVARERYATCLG